MNDKKHFEANMLDGDPVEDCGKAMLSAASVWEYITERDASHTNQEVCAVLDRLDQQKVMVIHIPGSNNGFIPWDAIEAERKRYE